MFAGVGERTREGNDLYKEMTESVSLYGFLLTVCHFVTEVARVANYIVEPISTAM